FRSLASSSYHHDLPPFPTRRSSDLKLASPGALSLDEKRRCPSAQVIVEHACEWLSGIAGKPFFLWLHLMDPHSPYHPPRQALELDRKSTRLNSSHQIISYAVFCLKK